MDPPYLDCQHRDGVLTGHRVVEHRGIQHAPAPARHRAAASDQLAHRVEYAVREVACAQLIAPQSQHRGMKRLTGQRQTRSSLPRHITRQTPACLPVRQALQRPEDHHRSDHLARHRQTAPTAPEQIGEQLVAKRPAAMLGQLRMHRPSRHKMPAHRRRVRQHPNRTSRALHPHSVPRAPTPHAEITANKSADS